MSEEAVKDKECPLCNATSRVGALFLHQQKMNIWKFAAISGVCFLIDGLLILLKGFGDTGERILLFAMFVLGLSCVVGAVNARRHSHGSRVYGCKTEDARPHCHRQKPVLFGGRWFTTDKPVYDRSEVLITGHIVILRPTAWKQDKRKPSFLFQPEGSRWQNCWAQGLYDNSYTFVSDDLGRSIGVQLNELLHLLNTYTDVKDLIDREDAVRTKYEAKLEKLLADYIDLMGAAYGAIEIAQKSRTVKSDGPAAGRIRILLEKALDTKKTAESTQPEAAVSTGAPA